MRKLMITVGLASLLALTAASLGVAGGGPRLNGTFEMTGKVGDNDIGVPIGTATTDTYVFKSTCGGTGGCPKVSLTRKSGNRNLKSTLSRKAPGVYKGVEGPAPYVCVDPIGIKGQFTGSHKITVTKARKGKATKIADQLVIHITGCTETFEEGTMKGSLAP